MNTYCKGFQFRKIEFLTKNDFICCCQMITDKLNQYYRDNNEQYTVQIVPEPISEGGMVFRFNRPGNNTEWYKSMRIWFQPDQGINYYKYPWIKGDELESWKNNNDFLVYPKTYMEKPVFWNGNTVLKAFSNAPAWTLEELKIFKEVFETKGIKIVNFPRKL